MICFIIPPHILEAIAKNGSEEQKKWAKDSIEISERIRKKRSKFVARPSFAKASDGKGKDRIIYTDNDTTNLPGNEIGKEGTPPTDTSGKEAYDGTGATFDLYWNSYQRNSIDGNGLPLISTVHYSVKYDNAFWDGEQMVYGDGDGQIFGLFTKPIDVTGHELTHGVTQYTANLEYQDQSGALNESFSDVFGTLVKQQSLIQSADKADWLIGEGIFVEKSFGKALRSMKAPGTAYNNSVLGKDPQPSSMKDYLVTSEDNGGVHINSGIPNHAFYLASSSIGGNAWESAGRIWYETLTKKLKSNTNFTDCAYATIQTAGELFGTGSKEEKAVEDAWKSVGVI